MKLTNSQLAAIDAFKAFLESDSQVFILKGAAGTGKTTIVSEFIKILDDIKRKFALMAPTGRAAFIIGKKTGRGASTIHRAIYGLSSVKSTSQNKEDEDDGGLHARFCLRNNDAPLNAVYIIDESSMISDAFSENEAFSFGSGRLLTDLFQFARGRKLIFVGDHAQLPPVGMNFSPALDADYLSAQFSCRVEEVVLSEVMRQAAGSCMLANANSIRDHIEKKTFIEFKLIDGSDSAAENINLLAPYYSLSEGQPCVSAAVIAYSNRQALQYNLAVRRHYFGEHAPRLKEGDLLMIGRNNYAFDYELFNGNVVRVEACAPDSEVQTHSVRVKFGKDRIESVDLRFRDVIIRFQTDNGPESLTVKLLDNFLDDPNGSIGGLLARALVVDFNNRLPEPFKSRYNEIRRLLRSGKRLTKEQQELCDAYLKLLQHDCFYNAVVCKYGYAMTCHKAQGGEWDNVFVDMCRFGGTANEDYFRWAYTALTRASRKIWHYRSPDFNYVSNLVVEQIKPSAKIKVSNYSDSEDFCSARFARIQYKCAERGFSVSEDRSKSYQHIITFTDCNADTAMYQLWYNAKGYSGKDILIQTSSQDFAALCRSVIDYSLAPSSVPFSAPDRPFAEKLVAFMRTQLEEAGIQLLNITQEKYQDVFHLKTDGFAQIGLTYTAKGNYTFMRLVSSLGPDDIKLQALRQRFI